MALAFVDSMDLYGAAADFGARWLWNSAPSYNATAGRFGGKALGVTNGVTVRTTMDSIGGTAAAKFYLSVAVRFAAISAYSSIRLASSENNIGTTSPASAHLSVGPANDGKLNLMRGNTIIATSAAAVIVLNQWHRVEIGEVYIHATAGTIKVRVDGVEVIDFVGNTLASGSAEVGAVGFSSTVNTLWVDDVMAWTGEGAAPNGWVGDFRVDALLPNANGSTVQGTAVGAASAVLAIDEVSSNGDTDYVSDTPVGNINLFGMADLPGSPSSIIAAAVSILGRSDGTSTRKVQLGIKSGASTGWASREALLVAQASYVGRMAFLPTDPATGAAWTVAAINAMEAGWRVSA